LQQYWSVVCCLVCFLLSLRIRQKPVQQHWVTNFDIRSSPELRLLIKNKKTGEPIDSASTPTPLRVKALFVLL
jgi:hypothetical protein